MSATSSLITKKNEIDTGPIVAAFCPAQADACALYRQFIPHINLEHSRYLFDLSGFVGVHNLCEAKIVVVQRQGTLGNFKAIKIFKMYGLKVIYDLDDDIWNVPAYNPGYRIFQQMREGFEQCLQLCDLLTVSTRGLKKAVTTALPGIKVPLTIIPNAMDFKLFGKPLIERDSEHCIIGWSGSATHSHDIAELWTLLPEIITTHENTSLELIGGADIPPQLIGHPRVMKRPWCAVAEYPRRCTSWGWDIFVAPVENYRFSQSKSNIKMLEAVAMGAVPLVSDISPYNEFCSLREDLKFLLCRSLGDWKAKLHILVSDSAYRSYLLGLCRQVTEEYFTIDTTKEIWKHWFKELCR